MSATLLRALVGASLLLHAGLALPDESNARHTNRLVDSNDPYLLLHAHNPVDWYPWGPEALAKARAENKPIFLSVGYSTCYWCHVAERTLYSDPAIAKLMNEWFINIKVDREQRPDLDHVYMLGRQILTGNGGWPNNVFLTPDLKPFYAGSYFPLADDALGRPGFANVLKSIHDAWVKQPERVRETAERVHAALEQYRQRVAHGAEASVAPADWLQRSAVDLQRRADREHGGFQSGGGTKFPHEPLLDMLLSRYVAKSDARDLEVLTGALDAMAYGGVNDQLAGGFHRYSTEPTWSIPHFEKMLYDNAQLLKIYAGAYEATGRNLYRYVASSLRAYLAQQMTAPEGGFYTAQDADIDGEEGASYVWTRRDIELVLKKDDARRFFDVYTLVPMPVQLGGPVLNLVDRGVLRVRLPIARTLERAGYTDPAAMLAALAPSRMKLVKARDRRKQPFRDEKILVGMNGLAIEAFSDAARIFKNARDIEVTKQAAERIWTVAYDPSTGRLKHEIFRGRAQLDAYLEDYALFGRGLIALHRVTKEPLWLSRAVALADRILGDFVHPDGSLATTLDEKALIVALADDGDDVHPSGTSASVDLLLRLDRALGKPKYASSVERIVRRLSGRLETNAEHWPILVAALNSSNFSVETVQPDSATFVHVSAVARPKDDRDEIIVTVKVDTGYHVNANPASYDYLIPTSVSFESPMSVGTRYPAPVVFKPGFAREGIKVYEGTVALTVEFPKGALQGPRTIHGTLSVQACNDEVCLPPARIPVTLRLGRIR